LKITGATLNITGRGPGTFIFAKYGSLTGDFAVTNGMPQGGYVRTNYGGGNQIAIVVPARGTVLRLR
jgi:hypothetical protein